MSGFVLGILYKEFTDLSPEEVEILRAVMHYELFTSEAIKQQLVERAQAVLARLRPPPGAGSPGIQEQSPPASESPGTQPPP
jgi:hypothetical protein